MWDQELVTGAVAIAGILGTYLAPYRTQRKIAGRSERRTFRKAKRAVAQELAMTGAQCKMLLEQRRTPQRSLITWLPTDAWDIHHETLEESLKDADWEGIPQLMVELGIHRQLLIDAGVDQPLSDEALEALKVM